MLSHAIQPYHPSHGCLMRLAIRIESEILRMIDEEDLFRGQVLTDAFKKLIIRMMESLLLSTNWTSAFGASGRSCVLTIRLRDDRHFF